MKRTNKPEILTRFHAIQPDKKAKSLQTLPNKLPLPIKEQNEIAESINLSLQFWHLMFDPEQLKESLTVFIQLSLDQRNQNSELKKYLKELRKAGLVVKSVLDLYTTNGSPIIFSEFVKNLGKLNDSYTIKNGTKFAQKTLQLLSDHLPISFSTTPVNSRLYKERLLEIKLATEKSLQSPFILVPDYHDLRKNLRHIKNIYQLAVVRNPHNSALLQTYHFLSILNTELGKVHDEFAKQKITDKDTYSTTQMTIPTQLFQKMKIFYAKMVF